MEEKKPPDAIGYMARRQGRAGNVLDIAIEAQRARDRLAHELVAPVRIAHLRAVDFEVLDDLNLADAAVGVEAERVRDQFMLADHLVNEEPADHPALDHGLPDRRLRGSDRQRIWAWSPCRAPQFLHLRDRGPQ